MLLTEDPEATALPPEPVYVVCATPVVGGKTIASFVLVSPAAKLLTTWKSNTSLYAPPRHPSLNVRGAFVQLVILTAFCLSLALVDALYPLPDWQSNAFIVASTPPPGITILVPLIINSSPGVKLPKSFTGIHACGVGYFIGA